jgi:hypothetical protein
MYPSQKLYPIAYINICHGRLMYPKQSNKHNLLFILVFTLVSTFLSFPRLDLVPTAPTSKVVVVLAYLQSRHRLVGGEAPSSSVGGAPDYRQNRQNRIVRFAKSEGSIFSVLNRSLWLLFDSCANTFW